MSPPLQLLLIEDNDDDAFLVLRELRRAGYDFSYQQIDQLDRLPLVLMEKSWDLVISDYFLSGFTAMDVLQQIEGTGIDIPFIVVSGTVGEDMAVAMMKAGAHDYLIKSNLKRLAPAIERELREAQMRQQKRATEQALKQAFDELEQLVDRRTADLVRVNDELNVEIEERRRSEQRTHIQYLVTQAMAEASTLQEAVPKILQVLCDNLNWQIGELWLVNQQTFWWRLVDRWFSPDSDPKLLDTFSQTRIAYQETQNQQWFQNESTFCPERLPFQTKLPANANLPSAWSFPILGDREVLGSVLLFGQNPHQCEATISRLLLTLGKQIGQFIRRKQAEETILQLAAIVQSSEDAIISLSLDGLVLSWNAGAEKIYGYLHPEVIGKLLQTLIQPDLGEILQTLKEVPRTTMIDHFRAVHRHKNGSLIDVFMTVSPIKDSTGRVTGTSLIARDISDQRAIEKMKDEFIAIVSHELRTPLAALQGSLDLLLTGQLGQLVDRGQRLLTIAAKNTDRLVKLINDIIDLQSLESGQVIFDRGIYTLTHLCQQAIETIQDLEEQAQIELDINIPPIPLFVDPDRIVQLLVGLLSNAIKFSPVGGIIQLSAQMIEIHHATLPPDSDGINQPKPQDAIPPDRNSPEAHPTYHIPHHILQKLVLTPSNTGTEQLVLIQVQDQGPGITTNNLEAIFDRFRQADASDSRQQGGTGLGLAICRRIVHQHGGYLWAESVEGQGSTFCILLRAHVAE